jgi:hypothetical protein
MGPFKVLEKEYTVIIKGIKFQEAAKGFDETVTSFSIVDEEGDTHYRKSFDVEYDHDGFTESIGVSAYALEGRRSRGFRTESGALQELTDKEYQTVGLILYYSVIPSAPSAGVSCQVFSSQREHLVPLSAPLTVYGEIYELPRGSTPNTLRLLRDNTMKFGVWTGWFEVVVRVKVLDRLRVVPIHHYSTFDGDAFDVVVDRKDSEKDTFVRLFNHPSASSIPQHVIIRKDTDITFLWAHTSVAIEPCKTECVVSADEMPWLKIKIDGKEGFVRDPEDLLALGIHPAG